MTVIVTSPCFETFTPLFLFIIVIIDRGKKNLLINTHMHTHKPRHGKKGYQPSVVHQSPAAARLGQQHAQTFHYPPLSEEKG